MNLACQKFKAGKKTYSKCEKKIVFSKGPPPKCTFMYNGDTLEVVKQQFISRSGSFNFAKPRNIYVQKCERQCMV